MVWCFMQRAWKSFNFHHFCIASKRRIDTQSKRNVCMAPKLLNIKNWIRCFVAKWRVFGNLSSPKQKRAKKNSGLWKISFFPSIERWILFKFCIRHLRHRWIVKIMPKSVEHKPIIYSANTHFMLKQRSNICCYRFFAASNWQRWVNF